MPTNMGHVDSFALLDTGNHKSFRHRSEKNFPGLSWTSAGVLEPSFKVVPVEENHSMDYFNETMMGLWQV